MPVTTRSQRTTSAVKFVLPKPAHSYAEVAKNKFIMHMQKLMHCCETAKGKENKMRVSLQIFKYVNKELSGLIQNTSEKMWINFAATILIKTVDIMNQYNSFSQYDKLCIDREVVEGLNAEMLESRNFVTKLIKNNWNLSAEPIFVRAKEYIVSTENTRPRRNIKPVDYTGMDSREVVSSSGEIETVWQDTTTKEDPDYEFEEDEDEDEDEDEEEDEEDED